MRTICDRCRPYMVVSSPNVAITRRAVAYLAVQSGLQGSAWNRFAPPSMIMDRCEHVRSSVIRAPDAGVTVHGARPGRAEIDMTDRTVEGVAVDSQVRRP